MRIIEKIGWSGIGLSVPRSNLKEFNQREEASRPGIYVLHGPNPEGAQDIVYIGEADPLGRRLDQHQAKEFWTTAYVFTVQNDHLNKAHFQYLEAQVCSAVPVMRSAAAWRNRQTGNSITLSEPDKASADTFLEELLLCCPVFGLRAFEKPEPPKQQKDGNTRVLQESSRQSPMLLPGESGFLRNYLLLSRREGGSRYGVRVTKRIYCLERS